MFGRILYIILVLFIIFKCSLTKRALLILDAQNCTNNQDASKVVSTINTIRSVYTFDMVVRTTTTHCLSHVSFISQYKDNVSSVPLMYFNGNLCLSNLVNFVYAVNCSQASNVIIQMLIPPCCVNDTSEMNLLYTLPSDTLINRYSCQIDWYSAFRDNIGFQNTSLYSQLQKNQITSLYITGFGVESNVYYTARDAINFGYNVFVVTDAISKPNTTVLSDLQNKGVALINSNQISLAFQIENTNLVKKSLKYDFQDQYTTWQSASNYCSPNNLCNISDYCPNNTPLLGLLPSGSWAPVGNQQNQWISLSADDPCTLYTPYSPSSIQVPGGVPVLCCKTSSILKPSSPSMPPTRVHVGVFDDQVYSEEQITRVALIGSLCFASGIALGLGLGCYWGRKSLIVPKVM